MKPIRPATPGKPISAGEFNRGMESVRRSGNATADGLDRVRGPSGDSIRDPRPPELWVRITGKLRHLDDEGGSLGSIDDELVWPSYYSGIEQTTRVGVAMAFDRDNPIMFYADDLPLIEVTGNEDVPVDGSVVVRAYPGSDGGDHLTFKFEPEGLGDEYGSGSGCGGTRTRTLTIEATVCDADGNPCTKRTTIRFPSSVEICEEPADCSGGGSGGSA